MDLRTRQIRDALNCNFYVRNDGNVLQALTAEETEVDHRSTEVAEAKTDTADVIDDKIEPGN